MYTTLKKTEFLTIQEEMEGADHFPNFNKKFVELKKKSPSFSYCFTYLLSWLCFSKNNISNLAYSYEIVFPKKLSELLLTYDFQKKILC